MHHFTNYFLKSHYFPLQCVEPSMYDISTCENIETALMVTQTPSSSYGSRCVLKTRSTLRKLEKAVNEGFRKHSIQLEQRLLGLLVGFYRGQIVWVRDRHKTMGCISRDGSIHTIVGASAPTNILIFVQKYILIYLDTCE
jgi:hypothetical protein